MIHYLMASKFLPAAHERDVDQEVVLQRRVELLAHAHGLGLDRGQEELQLAAESDSARYQDLGETVIIWHLVAHISETSQLFTFSSFVSIDDLMQRFQLKSRLASRTSLRMLYW